MSASRDKTQKTTFVYSNLYQLYRKGKEAAQNADYFQLPGRLPSERNVLKTDDFKNPAAPQVAAYNPPSFMAKRVVEKPALLQSVNPSQNSAIQSLKDNLKTLNDLHARLRFMLEELKDIVEE